MQRVSNPRIAITLVMLLTALLAACGSAGGSTSAGKVNLTFWAYNDVSKQCDLFNSSHPNIQVTCIKKASSNNAFIPPLITALKAGNGPDVALIEYMFIPTMLANNGLVDLTKYGANDVKSQFQTNAWGQVQYGNAVYGYPQDTGPEQMYYNASVFKKAGITSAPTTWDEYYQDAKLIHALGPDTFISAFDPATDGWFQALFWQNGGIWFTIVDGKWKVNVNSAASKTVAAYWQKMVTEGLVDTVVADGDFTGGWGTALNTGKIATWIAPTWGASVVSGNAKDQTGNWAIAQMPQWTAGQNASAFWGGSGISVINDTKHPQEAETFVRWYLTDQQSQKIGVADISWFSSNIAANASFNSIPVPYYAGSGKAQAVTEGVSNVTIDSSWKFPPVLTDIDNAQNDGFAAAISNKTSFSDVLDSIQAKTVAALNAGSYPVAP